MTLTAGTRLGPYEILSAIGVGGMGEVYRARDTKLDRDVAIKVLPEAFVADPERVARFQREAKTLASLNHPNIAAIYGLESQERLRPHRAEDGQIRGEVSASARAGGGGPRGRTYDVSNDGQRFLMIKDNATGDRASAPASMVVVVNWSEELKAKVPVK